MSANEDLHMRIRDCLGLIIAVWSAASLSAGPRIEVLTPIIKDGIVVSCSMSVSAVLKRLVEFVEGDKDTVVNIVMLSKESTCSSNEYKVLSTSGTTISVAFKKIIVPKNSSLATLVTVVPDDPLLDKACSEINKLQGALCAREVSSRSSPALEGGAK